MKISPTPAKSDPNLAPAEVRRQVRTGLLTGHTSGFSAGYMQGNLAIIPEKQASDFLRYCIRNPKPCPLLAVGEPGDPTLPSLGDVDIRTDIARYRVFREGEFVESAPNLAKVWRDDLVAFVLGCSFSFESALERAGIPVRHVGAGCNAPMYITNIETEKAGSFAGPLVVSMRAFSPRDAIRASIICDRYPMAHGAPVHLGDPARIGIADISRPDFGDPPIIEDGDIPVFWACGVTPQLAIRTARPDLAITHEPGHMLVTDLLAEGIGNAAASKL